jgi:hypothetical protein
VHNKKGAPLSRGAFFISGSVPRSFWNVLPADSAALARASIVKPSFHRARNEVKKYKFRGVVDLEKLP